MDALKGADALLIVTEWKVFRSPNFDTMKALLKTPLIFDGRNLYEPQAMREMGFDYLADRTPVMALRDAIRRARVLVVGDVMLDRYWFGDVSRISPEAPVPVVHVTRNEDRLGGAGNVARNAAALGAQVDAAVGGRA